MVQTAPFGEEVLAHAIRSLNQPSFPHALSRVFETLAHPDNQLFVAYKGSAPPLILLRDDKGTDVFSRLDETYLRGAYLLDPYFDLHQTPRPEGAYRLADIAPDGFQRTRYYIDYYASTTLIDEVAFVCYPSQGVTLTFCLGRDAMSQTPFAAKEIKRCAAFAPVVAALVARHWADLGELAQPFSDPAQVLMGAARERHGISLSQRQAQVAVLILRGYSSGSIGLRLGLSQQTIKVFRKQLYARCGITSQAELFALMLPLLDAGFS